MHRVDLRLRLERDAASHSDLIIILYVSEIEIEIADRCKCTECVIGMEDALVLLMKFLVKR